MPESSKKIKEKVEALVRELFLEKKLLLAVLSGSSALGKNIPNKVVLRPLMMKGKHYFQATLHFDQKVTHLNLSPEDAVKWLYNELQENFKQILLCSEENDYQILVGRGEAWTMLKRPPTKKTLPLVHNRVKEYLLPEGKALPFLVYLGVMSKDGKIVPKMRDKFRQINRFLEMVSDILENLPHKKLLRIIDFGSGKAYLTFALYHYLHEIKGYELDLLGLDLKKDVIDFCQKASQDLQLKGLRFAVGDIHHHQPEHDIDMVVALHACDTATDAALEKAVKWNAKVILAVPCCQKEAFRQIKADKLNPLLKHGILKERFAALATDAIRAQLLELAGYRTQVMEFIDMEHTAKNLLIRAVKGEGSVSKEELQANYEQLRDFLHLKPKLEKLL